MKAAASGKHRRPLSLIFFIKFGFIPIASNQDIRHPVWRPTHDIADGFVINILAAFDDELIMDMTTNKAVGEGAHGKTKKISGDCLHNVLNEFRTVAFDSFPFLSGADTFIGYGFTAESIFSDARLYIAKSSIAALILLTVTVSDLGMMRETLYFGAPPLMLLASHTFA